MDRMNEMDKMDRRDKIEWINRTNGEEKNRGAE